MNLSELIETHKGRRSYPELARDCGNNPSAKRLQQLVRDEIRAFPDPATMASLARGLRVPQREVVLAAAESLGLDVQTASPRLVNLLPAATRELSEEQAAAFAHLVDVVVNDPVRALGSMEAAGAEDAGERREPTVSPELLAASKARAPLTVVEDDDLDQLDDERDDPPPVRGGRELNEAARRTTDEP